MKDTEPEECEYVDPTDFELENFGGDDDFDDDDFEPDPPVTCVDYSPEYLEKLDAEGFDALIEEERALLDKFDKEEEKDD